MLKQVQHDGTGDNEPRGSNGIAIAPKITADGGTLLLINPHTSFFFRSEQEVTSGEGLNVYGAATWGQFFLYQGFNSHAGWMHTSSGVDSVDEFAEIIQRRGDKLLYHYGSEWRPVTELPVTIRFRSKDGSFGTRSFTTWRTHHGPIVRADGDRWIAFSMMDKPIEALQQSFLRTKAKDLTSFLDVADRFKANSSNNTIFADDKGEIAYLHAQFVPKRDNRVDYTKPVDGRDSATDWHGLHPLAELPSTMNPPNGWVQNTNTWPYRAAGANSPDPAKFPRYMDMFGENYRGLHALKLLDGSSGWTLDKLQGAAYDNLQPGFAALIPPLVAAYDALSASDPRRSKLAAPIALLRSWDHRWSAASEAQTLAMFWGDAMMKTLDPPDDEPRNLSYMRLARDTTADQKIAALQSAVDRLERDFGSWRLPWAEVNRFQRISGAISQPFSDFVPSIPVPFASGNYGSLASFGSGPRKSSKKWYGTSGNSFVAVIEFGPKVRARAISAGGESGNPASKHFTDQTQRYADGNLREVYFYPEQLNGHTERVYKPGE